MTPETAEGPVAVHLPSLRFRRDGLLQAHTMYPRSPREPWASEPGYANVRESLIDCETGLRQDLHHWLVDENGRVVAHREVPADQHTTRWPLPADSSSDGWPDASERLLACVAASDGEFMGRRARRLSVAEPRVSYEPIEVALLNESKPLIDRHRPRGLGNWTGLEEATSPEDQFDAARASYLEWRRSVTGPASIVGSPAQARHVSRVQRQLDLALPEGELRDSRVRLLGGRVIEFVMPSSFSYEELREMAPALEAQLESAWDMQQVVRADCQSGLRIPVRLILLDRRGETLAEIPVPGEWAAFHLEWGWSVRPSWDLLHADGHDFLAEVCRGANDALATRGRPESGGRLQSPLQGHAPADRLLAIRRSVQGQLP